MSDNIRRLLAGGATLGQTQWGPSSLPHKDPRAVSLERLMQGSPSLKQMQEMDPGMQRGAPPAYQSPGPIDVYPPPPAGSDRVVPAMPRRRPDLSHTT